jgi:hypothetical protein
MIQVAYKMQGWYVYYTTPSEDNAFDINYDGILIVLVFIMSVRVAIHRIMLNTQDCSNETCSHVRVGQLCWFQQQRKEFFVEGIHWLACQWEGRFIAFIPLSRTVLEGFNLNNPHTILYFPRM